MCLGGSLFADDSHYLEEAKDVGHHDGLGGETGADDARNWLVRNVARRFARLALVLGRVLSSGKTKNYND